MGSKQRLLPIRKRLYRRNADKASDGRRPDDQLDLRRRPEEEGEEEEEVGDALVDEKPTRNRRRDGRRQRFRRPNTAICK